MLLLKKYISFFLFIQLCLITNAAKSQAKFIATINPTVIGKDESAELKLLVENAQQVDQITPPSLNKFIIVSGPYQESGMEERNGSIRKYVGFTYIIKPRGTGDFTIASATAKADGKILRSNPVSIKVTNAATGNSPQGNNQFSAQSLSPFEEPEPVNSYDDFILKKGENVQDKISRNIFIKATSNKTSCFVGEPLVVTYKLYTRLKSESNIIKNPSLSGFSVIDLAQTAIDNYTTEKINGRDYNVYTLRKAQLYPLQAGSDTLEAVGVENNIHLIKEEFINNRGSLNAFDGVYSAPLPAEAFVVEKTTLHSKPIGIDVKPLPLNNQPSSFSGAVGNFTLQSSVEKTSFSTDDAGKLRITIAGEGNLTLVNAPELKWPVGIEVFEASLQDNLQKLTVPVSGSKIYSFPFSISEPGSYTLPTVEFSFFDLATATYKIIKTQPILLTVTKGTGKILLTDEGNKTNHIKENIFETIFTNRWMIIIPLALIIIAGLILWLWFNRKKQTTSLSVKNELHEIISIDQHTIAINPFVATEAFIQNTSLPAKEFYTTINKELRNYLVRQLQLDTETMSKKSIEDKIDELGMPVELGIAINQLLNDIELELYTPFVHENKQQLFYERLLEIVQLIMKNQ